MSDDASPDDHTRDFANRLKFARISPQDIHRLRQAWPRIAPHLPRILNAFYAHIVTEPALAAKIGAHQARLQNAQMQHWQSLFNDGFSAGYFANALRIGQTHYRIALEPRWYIAATNSCSMN